MNYEALNQMGSWERKKAMYLLEVAEEIGYDTEWGQIGLNDSSGNVWLWSENHMTCLYMTINCDLTKNDIWVMYSSPENGHEFEIELGQRTLKEIEKWAQYVDEHHLEEEYSNHDGDQFWDSMEENE